MNKVTFVIHARLILPLCIICTNTFSISAYSIKKWKIAVSYVRQWAANFYFSKSGSISCVLFRWHSSVGFIHIKTQSRISAATDYTCNNKKRCFIQQETLRKGNHPRLLRVKFQEADFGLWPQIQFKHRQKCLRNPRCPYSYDFILLGQHVQQ